MFNNIKVLLIDDDEDDYLMIRDLLKDADHGRYSLDWKSTYQDGLKALHAGSYDACLLDYRLGEQTGLDFIMESRDLLSTVPIIFLTGLSDFDIDLRAMQVGASDYLVKNELTATLLDRSIRYSMKNLLDMNELREMRAQVLRQDRMASLGMLASSLAHEIGTPLGVIRGRAELMAKKNPNIKPEAEVITAQIDRISGLVKSLLRLARGEENEQILDIDLLACVEDVLKLIRPEIERKKIELAVDLPNGIVVRGQYGPMEQIFLNLIVNSIHAIEAKNQGHGRISIQAQVRGQFAYIAVEDSGTGIEEKNIAQLFRPFFTTKPIGEGTGLGLATSLKLAQSWGGSIEVSSPPEGGAKFTVILQCSKQAGKN